MKGVPLTPKQRQRIIDLRRSGNSYSQIAAITKRPYNTIAGICRAEGLQKKLANIITLICDPADIFKPGLREWKQCDLAAMLELSALPEGFSLTIGPYHIKVQGGIFVRNDGYYCLPNHSSALKWYPPAEAQIDKAEGAAE